MELCTWCIALVAAAPNQVDIRVKEGPSRGLPSLNPFNSFNSTLRDKLAFVHELIMDGFIIMMNGMSEAFVPVATWHADPICGPHLGYWVHTAVSPDLERRQGVCGQPG